MGKFLPLYCLLLHVLFLISCGAQHDEVVNAEIKNLAYLNCGGFSSGETGYVDTDNNFIDYEPGAEILSLEALKVKFDPSTVYGRRTFMSFSKSEKMMAIMNFETPEELALDIFEQSMERLNGYNIEQLRGFSGFTRGRILNHLIATPYFDSEFDRWLWSNEEQYRKDAIYKVLQGADTQIGWWLTFENLGEIRGTTFVSEPDETSNRKRTASNINLNCRIVRSIFSDNERWLSLLKYVQGLNRGRNATAISINNTLSYTVKATLIHDATSLHSDPFTFTLEPGKTFNVGGSPGIYLEESPHFNRNVIRIEINSKNGCNKSIERDELASYIDTYSRIVHHESYSMNHTGYEVSLERLCASASVVLG